jgi:hypothetical protein
MHLQMRTAPRLSPPDVEKLLAVLADAGVNLVGIGGSNVEFGGELALVPEDGQEDLARTTLENAGYAVRVVRVDADEGLVLCRVKNEHGALHACLAAAAAANLTKGRIIRDILIGIPDADDVADGVIPVHIYSEQVRTANAMGGNGTAPA